MYRRVIPPSKDNLKGVRTGGSKVKLLYDSDDANPVSEWVDSDDEVDVKKRYLP